LGNGGGRGSREGKAEPRAKRVSIGKQGGATREYKGERDSRLPPVAKRGGEVARRWGKVKGMSQGTPARKKKK